jgi:hypothetical protein
MALGVIDQPVALASKITIQRFHSLTPNLEPVPSDCCRSVKRSLFSLRAGTWMRSTNHKM